MWRTGALCLREEVEYLITAEQVPADRRIVYMLMTLAGLRFGEASAPKWAAYDERQVPLGKLLVGVSYDSRMRREKSVKSQRPREVPVHPVLAKALQRWREFGWKRVYGRSPEADDLVVPTWRGTNRNASEGWAAFQEDLERLRLRPRRQQDLRRTFITLARADGATKDTLEWISHGPRGDIVDVYTSFPWATLCEQGSKLDIPTDRHRPTVVEPHAPFDRLSANGGGAGALAASAPGASLVAARVDASTSAVQQKSLLQVPVGVTQVADIAREIMVTPIPNRNSRNGPSRAASAGRNAPRVSGLAIRPGMTRCCKCA